MKTILVPGLALLLVLSGVQAARAQDTIPAVPTVRTADTLTAIDTIPALPAIPAEPAPAVDPAGPYRAEPAAQPGVPCVRQVRRIAPPPSPRSFRRQWPLAALGSIAGWFVGDRIVGPKGNPLVILSGSTIGAIAGSHIQAASEGHANLGRSTMGGVLGAVPAGALLFLNQMDTYDEAETLTRGVIPVLGGSVQAAVTAGVTSSSLQPTRIQIIECPHAVTG